MHKARLCVMASGNGSNMEAIVRACKAGELKAEVSLVISDRQDAYVLQRAKNHVLPHKCLNPEAFRSKKEYEQEVLSLLRSYSVEYLILAGYMRIIGKVLLEAFPQRILNIHPALLPSFPGLRAIEQAFEYGVKVTGVTVHFVDEGVDTGPIVLQEAVLVEEEDTLETLTQKIHKVEHRIYKRAIQLLISGKLEIHGRKVRIKN